MRLPFFGDIVWSSRNGLIRTTKNGEVWSGGIKQTSLRYADMWGDALKKADISNPPTRVLMLGLAGGGALPAFCRNYPAAEVTCVEYDPAMVAIARALSFKSGQPLPQVIVSDAKEALGQLTESYELILVDLFVGVIPSPLVSDNDFWMALKERLVPGGTVILNVAVTSTHIYLAQRHFKHSKVWQYDVNTLCALS